MHRRISTTLNTLRQDLAAKLGRDFIHAACRRRTYLVRELPLDPGGHHPLVPHPGPPRQHRLERRLLDGRPSLLGLRLLPGPQPAPAGRLPGGPPRGRQGLDPGHRGGRTLARPSGLADRWLGVLHARRRGAASLLRTAGQPGQGVRLPGGPHPGPVPRRHRAAAGGRRGAVAVA